MRRALRSGLPMRGLSGSALPVAGSTRRIEPSKPTGSPLVRRSWVRSAPPSAVGGVRVVPAPPGGSPQGFLGVGLPLLPPPCP